MQLDNKIVVPVIVGVFLIALAIGLYRLGHDDATETKPPIHQEIQKSVAETKPMTNQSGDENLPQNFTDLMMATFKSFTLVIMVIFVVTIILSFWKRLRRYH